jgi:hypothetical protein
MFIVICTMKHRYQLVNFINCDRASLRRVTNDHCAVDTVLLVTYVQGITARRERFQFVPLFFESKSTFLGLLVQVPLVPEEVAGGQRTNVLQWIVGRCDKARLLIQFFPKAAQELSLVFAGSSLLCGNRSAEKRAFSPIAHGHPRVASFG